MGARECETVTALISSLYNLPDVCQARGTSHTVVTSAQYRIEHKFSLTRSGTGHELHSSGPMQRRETMVKGTGNRRAQRNILLDLT